MKNYIDENKTQKKINVKKIISLKEVFNKPIEELKLKLSNHEELDKLKLLEKDNAKTKLFFDIFDGNKQLTFELNDKRKIDQKLINSLKIIDYIK